MPRDKSVNHIKIMAAAREEFLERGYEKASMRSIADRCGMTAAGIYRHCKDKEDLFYQLVSPAEDKLMAWAKAHMQRYEEPVKKNRKMVWQDSFIDMMREVVYPNMEDYHILIAKLKGSKYENYLHEKKKRDRFLLSGRGGNAFGYPHDDDNFAVLAGSRISRDVTEGFQQGYLDLRNSLIADGTIVDGVFMKDLYLRRNLRRERCIGIICRYEKTHWYQVLLRRMQASQ